MGKSGSGEFRTDIFVEKVVASRQQRAQHLGRVRPQASAVKYEVRDFFAPSAQSVRPIRSIPHNPDSPLTAVGYRGNVV